MSMVNRKQSQFFPAWCSRLLWSAAVVVTAFSAGAAVAQVERSGSGDSLQSSKVYSSVDAGYKSIMAAADALIAHQNTQIGRMNACFKTSKFFDGSTCQEMTIDLIAPTVTIKTIKVEATRTYYKKHCCKKIWGACVSDKHWHKEVYCTASTKSDYSFDSDKNAVTVTLKECNPRIIWVC